MGQLYWNIYLPKSGFCLQSSLIQKQLVYFLEFTYLFGNEIDAVPAMSNIELYSHKGKTNDLNSSQQ